MRLAVIDLGTNTFHLLIVEAKHHGAFDELYRARAYVFLGEEGIETIGEQPFERGLTTLVDFQKKLVEYQVERLQAFGTAALRTATNGQAFIQEVKLRTGIDVSLIDGTAEARLICEGVRQALPLNEKPVLIMDIGGGSVEFLIANDKTIFWVQSFPIGLSVLYRHFHRNDPISTQDVQEIETFLTQELTPLFTALNQHAVDFLVGASGTFEILEQNIDAELAHPLHTFITAADFQTFCTQFAYTTLDERLRAPQIPTERAHLIVVALLLVQFILQKTELQKIAISRYAMKEGMLAALLA